MTTEEQRFEKIREIYSLIESPLVSYIHGLNIRIYLGCTKIASIGYATDKNLTYWFEAQTSLNYVYRRIKEFFDVPCFPDWQEISAAIYTVTPQPIAEEIVTYLCPDTAYWGKNIKFVCFEHGDYTYTTRYIYEGSERTECDDIYAHMDRWTKRKAENLY